MKSLTPASLPRWTVEAALLVAAAAEAAITLLDSDLLSTVFSFVAAAGLLLRRRAPWVSVILALPGLVFGCASIAAVIALYSLAVQRPRRLVLGGAIVVMFVAHVIGATWAEAPQHPVGLLTTAAMFALAPAAVGVLVATRCQLVDSLAALSDAHEEQRQRAATEAVRHERELLAREMHDVVSHQVSLMAVQAGALQVRAGDEASRTGARTIRQLCVTTLEELRTMLTVLRSGDRSAPQTAPQPCLSDIAALAKASGLDVTVDLELPEDLPAPAQRAVYRTIQEALTNARKHAPGATVRVSGHVADGELEVQVRNSAPHMPALGLPGSKLGLVGLSERAHILGGSVTSGETADGGYETTLRVPVEVVTRGGWTNAVKIASAAPTSVSMTRTSAVAPMPAPEAADAADEMNSTSGVMNTSANA